MAILPVRIYGDAVLREITTPVQNIDETINALATNMFATQAAQRGIGLAAPQVGLRLRMFTADTTELVKDGGKYVFINPEIIDTAGSAVYEEGCLSFPGVYFDVRRPKKAGIRYYDLNGSEHELETDGVLARIILHEYDHLDGRLYIDTLDDAGKEKVEESLRERGLFPARS